jgi:ketosteroid isomerase-like protein
LLGDWFSSRKGGTAMKELISRWVLVSAALFLQVGQTASPQSDDEGRILALETAWNHAEQAKDAAALDQLLASTLIYVDYDGTMMNKGQFLASIKADLLEPDQITNETMTVHMYSGAAVVTGVYREKGTLKGKPYSRRGRFTDTWISQNGSWQCVASQSTLISH